MIYTGLMWGNAWVWADWVLMCVVTVLFWAAVITAIVLAIRGVGGSSNTVSGFARHGSSHPDRVLAQRFARGRIGQDESGRRVTLLHEHG